MTGNNYFLNTLSRYCDSLWEYNIADESIFVHFDRVASSLEGQAYSADEFARIFKTNVSLTQANITGPTISTKAISANF